MEHQIMEMLQKLDLKIDMSFKQLNARMDKLEEKVDRLEMKVDNLEEKVNTLEVKVNNLEEKVDSLEVKVNSLEEKVDSLEMKVDKLEARVGSLETGMAGLEVRMDLLEERVNENSVILKALRAGQESFKAEFDGFKLDTAKQFEGVHKRFDRVERGIDLLAKKQWQNEQDIYELQQAVGLE